MAGRKFKRLKIYLVLKSGLNVSITDNVKKWISCSIKIDIIAFKSRLLRFKYSVPNLVRFKLVNLDVVTSTLPAAVISKVTTICSSEDVQKFHQAQEVQHCIKSIYIKYKSWKTKETARFYWKSVLFLVLSFQRPISK